MAELSTQTSSIVSKVWGLCNPLRDDGVSYGDYLEQLTYLIFLKMADEYSKPPYNRDSGIPDGCTWQDMRSLKGTELEDKYKSILETLGKQSGLLGSIFFQSANKISKAAILKRVVDMIDGEKWVSMSSDVKGIRAMVRCMRPEPGKTIADPCCGSGGFFLAAQDFIANENRDTLDRDQKEFLKNKTFYGTELVPTTFKLCLMNLYLHNIGDIYGLCAHKSSIWQKILHHIYERRRGNRGRGSCLQSLGVLDDQLQQAAELCSAHLHDPEFYRKGCRGCTG